MLVVKLIESARTMMIYNEKCNFRFRLTQPPTLNKSQGERDQTNVTLFIQIADQLLPICQRPGQSESMLIIIR